MPKSTSAPATTQALPASYEAAAKELETLIRQMESAQLPLDQLLISYERGAFLLSFCRSKLQALEQQVRVIDQGQLKPWRDER